MNKWILIAICSAIVMLTMLGCSSNRTAPDTRVIEPYNGITTKVAILPLKSMDTQSRYIEKILTVRDLEYAFASHPKYILMPMDEIAEAFKQTGFKDVEDLEPEDLKEISDDIKGDVMITGSITMIRPDEFAIAMKLYSARTSELRQLNFNVSKMKEARWKTLDERLIGELDSFISTEVDKIFNIALNYFAANNYPEAEKSLQMAMGLNPDLKDADYYLGATYYKMGKTDLAIQSLEKSIAKDPNHQQSLFMLAEIYEKSNQPLKRLGIMEKMASLNNDEELWLVIGNLYVEQKNIPKAEAALKEAVKIDPEYAIAQSRLALLLYDEGRYNDAIPYLEFVFDRFPENDLISRRLAVSYQRTNRLDDAIGKYELLIKNNPQNTQAYLSAANLYRIKASEVTDPKLIAEINQKAIATMNELKKVQPANALAYLNLATIYMSQSKFAEVETNANLARQNDPTLYLPLVYLATVSQNKGTTEYNRFADLEQKAAKAVGKQANQLKKDRDNAKNAALTHFRKAAEHLNSAVSLTTETESINDINNRLNTINKLISQVSGY